MPQLQVVAEHGQQARRVDTGRHHDVVDLDGALGRDEPLHPAPTAAIALTSHG